MIICTWLVCVQIVFPYGICSKKTDHCIILLYLFMVDGSPVVEVFPHKLILGNETICMFHWVITICISILNVLKCPSVSIIFILLCLQSISQTYLFRDSSFVLVAPLLKCFGLGFHRLRNIDCWFKKISMMHFSLRKEDSKPIWIVWFGLTLYGHIKILVDIYTKMQEVLDNEFINDSLFFHLISIAMLRFCLFHCLCACGKII